MSVYCGIILLIRYAGTLNKNFFEILGRGGGGEKKKKIKSLKLISR